MVNCIRSVILIMILLVSAACSKKRDSPFCFPCESGRFTEAYDNDLAYSVFIRGNGDTLAIIGAVSKTFRAKEGVPVCASLKKHKGMERAIYVHPTYEIRCITKTGD